MKMLFLVFIFLISTPLYAEVKMKDILNMSLDEVMLLKIKSTSFLETSILETPAYTLIVDMDDVEHSPARNLYDILHMYVPGTYMGVHGRSGPLHGVRGILTDANTKTIVTLDGQHLNQRIAFGYKTGMVSPLMGDLDRIEITNGPGALTQGSGAINGFINMIPKNGEDNPGTFLNTEHGFTEKAYVLETGHGLSYGQNKNLYLYAGAYDAEGFEPDNTYDQETTYPINAYGFGEAGYRISSYWKHRTSSLNAFYFKDTPVTGAAETGNIGRAGSWQTAAAGLRPKLDLELTQEHILSFIGSLMWIDHNKITPGPTGTTVDGGSESHSDITVVYKTTSIKNNALALGTSYGYKKFREKDQYLQGDLSSSTSAVNTSWREFSLFTEDRFTIIDPLSLTIGLRYDKYFMDKILTTPDEGTDQTPFEIEPEVDDEHFSPQILLAYEITPETITKLSYRHGYRMPDPVHFKTVVMSNRVARGMGLPTHDLEPETMGAYEFNLHSQLSRKLSVDFNLFHNEFKNQLSWEHLSNMWGADADAIIAELGDQLPSNHGMMQNLADEAQSNGGELIVNWEFISNTILQCSYSYVEVDNELPQRTPVNIVKFGLIGSLMMHKLHYSLNYLFGSAMDNVGNPSTDKWHYAYKQDEHLVNLSLNYDVYESGNIYLRVHNLFEDDRPVMTFDTPKPYKGFLGSDERRIYLGFRTGF